MDKKGYQEHKSGMFTVGQDFPRLKDVLESIKEGRWALPKFQREFVWLKSKDEPHPMVELLDSIFRGIPFGVIFVVENVKPQRVDQENDGDIVVRPFEGVEIPSFDEKITVVLDGQQRLTTALWAMYRDLNKEREFSPVRLPA